MSKFERMIEYLTEKTTTRFYTWWLYGMILFLTIINILHIVR